MGFGSFAGGMAAGLNTGIRTGTLMNESKMREDQWGLEKRQRTLEVEKQEAARRAEELMNEAGYKVFKAYEQAQGGPVGAGPGSGPEYSGSGMSSGSPGGVPPFDLMMKVSDARMFAAMDAKRPDLAIAEASKGMALREAHLQQAYTEADRDFAISGDVNAYARAINRIYPATNIQATPNPDGSIRLQGTRLGQPIDETVKADELSRRIQMAFDPKAVRSSVAAMALKRFESNLKREEEAAKGHVIPEGSVLERGGKIVAQNPKSDKFTFGTTTDEEGRTSPYAGNTSTGEITQPGLGGGGGEPPPPGYNRKDLPGEKEVVDLLMKNADFGKPNPLGGPGQLTEQGQKALPLASGARTYGRGPNGEKLSPAAAVQLAQRAMSGAAKAQVAIKRGSDGKTYRVPVIVDGKREVQIGPMEEITSEVSARARADQEDAARDMEGSAGIGPRTMGLGTNRVSGQIR